MISFLGFKMLNTHLSSSYYYYPENLQSRVLEDGCLKAVLAYSESADTELQFWASALLLNMAMTSDGVKKEIIMLGGLKSLMELAIGDSDHPQCSAHAAKTLVMLGFLGEWNGLDCK